MSVCDGLTGATATCAACNPPTDRELLAAPGGAYAVLRRLREAALAELREAQRRAHDLEPWPADAPPSDPWARPSWDADTAYLPCLSYALHASPAPRARRDFGVAA